MPHLTVGYSLHANAKANCKPVVFKPDLALNPPVYGLRDRIARFSNTQCNLILLFGIFVPASSKMIVAFLF
jgi:hypothetical protein